MATGLIGNIKEFDATEESWESYIERLEIFIDANDIKAEKKVSTLLTVMGLKTYNLLKNLCAPDKPTTKTFAELVKLVDTHLSPKPSFITERYKFSLRSQHQHESIADYIVQLKELSMHCDFKSNLPDYLRDRLVSGLRSDAIKKRLLAEADLTYDSAVKIATSMEMADREAATLTSSQAGRGQGQQIAQMRNRSSTNGGGSNFGGSTYSRQNFKREESAVSSDKCFCCGKLGHRANKCKFKSYKCNKCGKIGHLVKVCRSSEQPSKSKVGLTNQFYKSKDKGKQHYVDAAQEVDESSSNGKDNSPQDLMNMFSLDRPKVPVGDCVNNISRVKPVTIDLEIENKTINFEIDSGACVSVISDQCYKDHFSSVELKSTNLVLSSYTNQPIKPLGKILVNVKYLNLKKELTLYVIANGANPLLGRDWIKDLQLVIQIPESVTVKVLDDSESKLIDNLYVSYPDVFSDKLGCYKGKPVNLVLKENANPKFLKPRTLPFALKDQVKQEIDRLVEEGILTSTSTSEWGTPIVPVIKKNGDLRICADFRSSTLNDCLIVNRHPIPRIEDLLNSLQKGEKYSKIDLSQAYQQLSLDDKSKQFCTISTPFGLYRYNRLPYGVSSGPGLFQELMEKVLSGIPGVVCFLDDILVSGVNTKVHFERLNEVFSRLSENGLTVSKKKCQFFKKSIEYLGFVLSQEGLSTAKSKVDAINNAPTPTNVNQVKAFLGMVNYYCKYVPNMSTIATPLYKLLRKDTVFDWSLSCKQAFELIKSKLVSAPVLAHYDPDLPLQLATDSSAYGLGCVLSQIQKDGSEKPICYASRTLTKSEVGYSVIDKEALAIIYGVKRFNQYLYGRKFTLLTDHKPLLSIFGPKRGLKPYAASRLQRYAMFLTNYDFDIKYVTSQANANADCLSRLPVNVKDFVCESDSPDYTGSYLQFFKESEIPIDFTCVKLETKKDPILNRVLGYILYGWPLNRSDDQELQPFFRRQVELTVEQGIVMWGHRVVIPSSLQSSLLAELHCGHLGIVKMKAMARSYFWWPNLDSQIENLANSCPPCLAERQNPSKCVLHVWEYPKTVWSRIHCDFLGPFQSKLYLVVVDAYSKWLEVEEVSSTSAKQTISKLRSMFARFGLVQQVVTDNGPPFSSFEFNEFLKCNGIKHTCTPTYSPKSNGQAENSVKSVKKRLKCAVFNKENVELSLNRFLLAYRNAVHSTTGETPAKLMFNRPLRSRLDLIRPNLAEVVGKNQSKQIENYRGSKTREFVVGQPVIVRDYRGKNKWVEGEIVKTLSLVSYLVKLTNGVIWKRHVDQIIGLQSTVSEPMLTANVPVDLLLNPNPDSVSHSVPAVHTTPHPSPILTRGQSTPRSSCFPSTPTSINRSPIPHQSTPQSVDPCKQTIPDERRYPSRNRKPVVKLNL